VKMDTKSGIVGLHQNAQYAVKKRARILRILLVAQAVLLQSRLRVAHTRRGTSRPKNDSKTD